MAPRLGLQLACLTAALGMAAGARAADAPSPDKSGFSLFDPTPSADLRSFCTDRPTKSTGSCTVDAGHWQLEADLYNFTSQSAGGVTTTTELYTNPTLKLGLTNTVDIEANIAPYEAVRSWIRATGATSRSYGIGDLFLRVKWSLLGDDGGDLGFALVPYVKAPTAPAPIGDGAVEEGLIAPIQLALPANWQLVIDPEVDVLADQVGRGRHLNASGLLSFSYPLTRRVTVSVEAWGDENFDPAGKVTQASIDLGAAWIPARTPNLQFDGGVNLGANRATPQVQAYVGVSHRF